MRTLLEGVEVLGRVVVLADVDDSVVVVVVLGVVDVLLRCNALSFVAELEEGVCSVYNTV